MLHQNNRGMQSTGGGRLGDGQELVRWGSGAGQMADGSGLMAHGRMGRTSWPWPTRRTPSGGQHHRWPGGQGGAERDHRRGGGRWISLRDVQRQRAVEPEIAGPRAAQRGQVRPDAEPLAQVVRQGADVEARGAVHGERHVVAIKTHNADGVRSDAGGGG